ncbi:hypothetical protein V3F56_02890 [Moorellaceae bacterium AZ2]
MMLRGLATFIRSFIRSEEGDIIEWLVGALILGLGFLPIIAGIANALEQTASHVEDAIRDIVESGY